ncbi:MAG: HD domain-containing protein, partial [Proteobacteria bacterium]|nr:HD domain-containing protein [Pseudomonadota bacterium]
TLSDNEFEKIKEHTFLGSRILGDEPRLKMAREIAQSHHERYNGSGYPQGLKGDEIPLSARIVALADIYDALRSKRSYKEAFSHEKTLEIILKGNERTNPSHFDPQVVAAFVKREKDFERIFMEFTDNKA